MSITTFIGRFYNPFTPLWADRSIFDYLEQVPKGSRIINIGSGSTRLRDDIINLDITYYPNVDVLADAQNLPFEDNYFDCVFCNAVLEHVEKPWMVSGEIQRVLKSGGIACIQSPFLEAVHDEHDYFRFTLKGLKSLFPQLKEIKSGVSGGVSQILADLLRVYPTFIFENTILDLPVKFIMSWVAKPFQYLDFIKSPSMFKYARAYYFIGEK